MENQEKCVVCEVTSQELPLIPLKYGDATYYICPQHLPVLIHEPAKLVGKLPGAEQLKPHAH